MSLNSTQSSSLPGLKLSVKTEREIAYESPDHLVPWGTRRDNHTNRRFNVKLYKLYPQGYNVRVLDMGCSGGAFVKDCLDDGMLAVGLEGSDYSKRLRRAEWRTIPEFLFTGDITGEFEIHLESPGQSPHLAQFDVVTSWEVMEHIAERDLPQVAANVKKHLAPGGLWIMSVSPDEDIVNGVNLHQTMQQKPWWINKFKQLGLEHREEFVKYFNTQWIRGAKYGYAKGGFHLVLCKDTTKLPLIPHEGVLRWIYDRWLGSMPQRFLAGSF